jgi:hypothetical protein
VVVEPVVAGFEVEDLEAEGFVEVGFVEVLLVFAWVVLDRAEGPLEELVLAE